MGSLARNFKEFTASQYKDVMNMFVGSRKDREEVGMVVGQVLAFDKARKRFLVNY